jgi:hypothetical protein
MRVKRGGCFCDVGIGGSEFRVVSAWVAFEVWNGG